MDEMGQIRQGETMVDWMNILMVVGICVSSMLYEILFFQIIEWFDIKNKRINIFCLFTLKLFILVFCLVLQFPLVVLLSLYFFSYCIYYFPYRRASGFPFWFWIHLRFIHFASFHIIVISALALLNRISLYKAYHSQILWLWALFLTLVFQILVAALAKKLIPQDVIKILLNDKKRIGNMIIFGWFCIVYLFLDSISVLFDLPYRLFAWYLLGSCALLLWLYYLLISHTYQIIMSVHYETEYYVLEAERLEHIKKELYLRNLAYQDGLTGVYTRRFSVEVLDSLLRDRRGFTLAYVDLNGLKKVNDHLGHYEGDRYIVTIAHILNSMLRKNDTLARIGGDEFLIISQELDGVRMHEMLEQKNKQVSKLNDKGYIPSFSYGITNVEEGEQASPEELLRRADSLMYQYKKTYAAIAGGNL